ncbi:MAG: UDP-N-acetylmuramoyl-L-alanyl-D-glutamate--2,6-diaminopimelate ligase [Candidatus Marinimicrobia bacterium]|nr:UDP-N-acetylmuramoyl-L-alanyl-D-glutamate--2,6-diaminopimelate ligase [Candidatus Neomarinimicrobiota bacterium]
MQLLLLLQELQVPFRYEGGDAAIHHIEYDSRQVKPGTLFVAIKGFQTDGHAYISDAVKRGAVACIVEHAVDCDCPQIIVLDTRTVLAELSFAFYNIPTYPLFGVTGTNGKTTITHLLYQLAESAGMHPALIGTLGVKTQNSASEGERTTPESRDLAALLQGFSQENIDAAFMEVSSHALALKRVHSLQFDAAIFTNLTQDHLDFHPDMEAYFRSKTLLFKQLKPGAYSIINIDDPYGKRLNDMVEIPKMTYSVQDSSADVYFSELSVSVQGIKGILNTPNGPIPIRTPLLGRFNAENIAGSIAAWLSVYPEIPQSLNNTLFRPIPGRMEMIHTARGTAVIDYAHTPDAMEKALKAASQLENKKRIITVFGCGGDRDREKRPLMGEIAIRYSDEIILTNDNPRNEPARQIVDDILRGMGNTRHVRICLNRKKALTQAYNLSTPDDLLMIMGKGAETYMEIKGEKIPFNDKEIILTLETNK